MEKNKEKGRERKNSIFVSLSLIENNLYISVMYAIILLTLQNSFSNFFSDSSLFPFISSIDS